MNTRGSKTQNNKATTATTTTSNICSSSSNTKYVECECHPEPPQPVDELGDYVSPSGRFNVCEIVKCYETQINENLLTSKKTSTNVIVNGKVSSLNTTTGPTNTTAPTTAANAHHVPCNNQNNHTDYVVASNSVNRYDLKTLATKAVSSDGQSASASAASLGSSHPSVNVIDDKTTEIVAGEKIYRSHTIIANIPNGIRIITEILCNENEDPLQIDKNKIIKTDIPPSTLLKKFTEQMQK